MRNIDRLPRASFSVRIIVGFVVILALWLTGVEQAPVPFNTQTTTTQPAPTVAPTTPVELEWFPPQTAPLAPPAHSAPASSGIGTALTIGAGQ